MKFQILDYVNFGLEGLYIIWSCVIFIFAIIWLRAVIKDSMSKMKRLKSERLLGEHVDVKTMENQLKYNKLIIFLIIIALLYHITFITNTIFFAVFLELWKQSANSTSSAIALCGSFCMFASGAPISLYQLYYLSIAMIITQIWCVYKNKHFYTFLYWSVLSIRTLFLLVLWTVEKTYLIGKTLTSTVMVFDLVWIAAISINTYQLMDRNLQLRVRQFRIHLDDNLINAQKRSVARFKLAILSFYPLFLMYTTVFVIYISVSIFEVIEMDSDFIHEEYGPTPGTLPRFWGKSLVHFYNACDLVTNVIVIFWDMPFLIIGFSKLKGIYQFETAQ
ncbi:hypothetical protein LOD99_4376 [Oopsacas minuta]|uniref:Uncharacterized protein n=1 Tax=Oopsacas minuta TaxID=111878 RepID=A0AAV7JVA9_9METZ|nr:hypothetical protein LOD99_4376 [Oopsacas minuta]